MYVINVMIIDCSPCPSKSYRVPMEDKILVEGCFSGDQFSTWVSFERLNKLANKLILLALSSIFNPFSCSRFW